MEINKNKKREKKKRRGSIGRRKKWPKKGKSGRKGKNWEGSFTLPCLKEKAAYFNIFIYFTFSIFYIQGSRPVSRRSQYSYASASTSVPMGSEPDLDFPQVDDQQMEQPAEEQHVYDEATAGTPKAATPIAGNPQGRKFIL